MFRPSQMEEIYILGLRKDREYILRKLQDLGTIHIKKPETTRQTETPPELIHDAVQSIEQIRDIKKVLHLKKSIFSKKRKKIKIEETTDTAFTSASKRYIYPIYTDAKKILKHEKEENDRRKDIEKKTKALEHFRHAGISTDSFSSNSHFISSLGMTEKKNLKTIKKYCDCSIIDETETKAYIIFIAKKDEWKKIENMIETIKTEHGKTIGEQIKYLEKEIDTIEKEITLAEKSAAQIQKEKDMILAYEERWKNIKARLSKEKMLNRTKKTFFLNGWIPKKNIEKLESNKNIVIYTQMPKTEPPVKLENPAFAKPFEKITKWFGLPKYGEIDPTIFIAITFPIFFAIMLTDMGYGLILLIASIIAYLKTDNKDLKSIAYILAISSALTVIVGAAFGSIFGEFFGFRSIFDSLRDPITILKISLIIGLVHINFGLGLNLYSKIKARSRDIIEPLAWISLETGIALLILSKTSAMTNIGYILIISAVIYRSTKGITGFLSIPSFFGSWISYIRLMALAVATSWLQFVINMGVTAAAKVSIILAAVIFIFGHAFNMSLNVVSAFVHSMRLHYVEFFEQFYESGGEEFMPLKNEKKYSE